MHVLPQKRDKSDDKTFGLFLWQKINLSVVFTWKKTSRYMAYLAIVGKAECQVNKISNHEFLFSFVL